MTFYKTTRQAEKFKSVFIQVQIQELKVSNWTRTIPHLECDSYRDAEVPTQLTHTFWMGFDSEASELGLSNLCL